MQTSPILLLVLATVLAGCAHDFTLIPRHGEAPGQGVAQEIGKKVTITLKGKTYTGTYVYGGGGVAFFATSGSATAFSGTQTAMAVGSGFGTAYIPGSGNGRILATAPDGDAVRCDFQYANRRGLGVCQDNAGTAYDLQIHN